MQHEKIVQTHVVQLLAGLGAHVYTLGTRRSRGTHCPRCHEFVPEGQSTRQTPGISDIFSFLPAFPRLGIPAPRLLIVEVKAERGRLSPEQRAFADQCTAAGIAHVVGGVDEVIEWLLLHQYLQPHQVTLGHQHKELAIQRTASFDGAIGTARALAGARQPHARRGSPPTREQRSDFGLAAPRRRAGRDN